MVAEEVAEVRGITDEKDRYRYEAGPSSYEGTAATEARGASVAVVTNEGLDEHTRDGTTEPNEGSPSVRDAEKLDVRGQ